MGNLNTKAGKGPSYRYNVHGLQYLDQSPKHENKKDKKDKTKTSNNSSEDKANIKQLKQLDSNLKSGSGRKRHNSSALYVSSDWTNTVYDAGSLADVDWLNSNAYPYENIVMSGGGSKGYAFIGALKALDDAGILANIKRVAGSSAGAICAGLIAVGCSPQDICDIFKVDIKWLFQDQKCAGCCCIPKIFHTYGVHPGHRFLRIYGQHIAKKTGDPDITFAQLYERYGRELCIVVTNLSKMCSEYCTYQNTPDLPIRTAVRMSMSFPMVYEAVKCEINGQTSLYTDGGTLDQYPVHCFDDKRLDLNHNSKQATIGSRENMNRKTLGIYVVSESAIDYKIWNALFGCKMPYKPTYLPDTKLARARLQIEFEKRKRRENDYSMKDFLHELQSNTEEPMFHYETCDRSTVDIRSFKDYFVTTIETLLISQRKLHIKPHDSERTIAVNCGYIGTNDYEIEAEDREFMLVQGYAHTEQFLKEFVKKSRPGSRLDSSLTSQAIREERGDYVTSAYKPTGTAAEEEAVAVSARNLTNSSIRFIDETFGSRDNLDMIISQDEGLEIESSHGSQHQLTLEKVQNLNQSKASTHSFKWTATQGGKMIVADSKEGNLDLEPNDSGYNSHVGVEDTSGNFVSAGNSIAISADVHNCNTSLEKLSNTRHDNDPIVTSQSQLDLYSSSSSLSHNQSHETNNITGPKFAKESHEQNSKLDCNSVENSPIDCNSSLPSREDIEGVVHYAASLTPPISPDLKTNISSVTGTEIKPLPIATSQMSKNSKQNSSNTGRIKLRSSASFTIEELPKSGGSHFEFLSSPPVQQQNGRNFKPFSKQNSLSSLPSLSRKQSFENGPPKPPRVNGLVFSNGGSCSVEKQNLTALYEQPMKSAHSDVLREPIKAQVIATPTFTSQTCVRHSIQNVPNYVRNSSIETQV